MKSLGLALAALVAWTGAVQACEVSSLSSLRSSDLESVTYQMGSRPEMQIEDSRRVVALVGFLKRLGASWSAGGAGGSSDGIIRFYESGGVAAKVFVGNDAVAVDSCKRKLNRAEIDELYAILIDA